MPTLYYIHYSPWSERARWALDYCGIDYQRIDYVPLVTEPKLRFATKRWTGKIGVPVLVGGGQIVDDSLEIARYAEAESSKTISLFPEQNWQDIYKLADDIANTSRAIFCYRMLKDDVALLEALPPFVPGIFQKAMLPTARMTVKNIGNKYRGFDLTEAEHYKQLDQLLKKARKQLGEKKFLFDEFGYIDMALASAFEFISPVDSKWIQLKPATKNVATSEDMIGKFSDLIRWRDGLYAEFR